jgi:hypothetical protein
MKQTDRLFLLAGLWLAMATASAAHAADAGSTKPDQTPPCIKAADAPRLRTSGFWEAVYEAFNGPQCQSVVRVLMQLQDGKKEGGRKLHDKPLNKAAAEKELAEARADPDFKAQLDAALRGVNEPAGRRIVEAAVLEDLGYFGARELLVNELAAAGAPR